MARHASSSSSYSTVSIVTDPIAADPKAIRQGSGNPLSAFGGDRPDMLVLSPHHYGHGYSRLRGDERTYPEAHRRRITPHEHLHHHTPYPITPRPRRLPIPRPLRRHLPPPRPLAHPPRPLRLPYNQRQSGGLSVQKSSLSQTMEKQSKPFLATANIQSLDRRQRH